MLDKEERRSFGVVDRDHWPRATPSTINVLDTGAASRKGFHARFLLREGKISGGVVDQAVAVVHGSRDPALTRWSVLLVVVGVNALVVVIGPSPGMHHH
jgi:hypothetical protein